MNISINLSFFFLPVPSSVQGSISSKLFDHHESVNKTQVFLFVFFLSKMFSVLILILIFLLKQILFFKYNNYIYI